jgi:hypothetical protein
MKKLSTIQAGYIRLIRRMTYFLRLPRTRPGVIKNPLIAKKEYTAMFDKEILPKDKKPSTPKNDFTPLNITIRDKHNLNKLNPFTFLLSIMG